jgi:long-chain acyl-CoA synthetase
MLIHKLLYDGAQRRPDRIAFHWVDRDRSLTYAEAVGAMEASAGALHELGVGKGDRVTIFAHNGLDYLVTTFGCFRTGAIAALVNVRFADELGYYLQNHEPKIVVYRHDMREPVVRAAAETPSVSHLICMDGPQEDALSLPQLMADRLPPPADPGDEDAIAHLSYTSGTAGHPKGACLSHEPVVRATRCIAERLCITGDDISLGPTALSSSYQLVANLLPPLHHSCTINVMGQWTPESGYDAVAATRATMLVANPPILADLLEVSRQRGAPPATLRLGLSGGGPVPPTLKRDWRDVVGLPLVESYGQSELGGFVGLGRPELPSDADLTVIGPTLPDKEVRIFDSGDREVPPGVVGEVVLRGGFMKGYWDMPEQTAAALRGGWLHTGDLGCLNVDGVLTLRGRRSELLSVRGEDWFPRDLEEALMRHEAVFQAALIGVPDAELGQRPVAFVTLLPDGHVDAETLRTTAAVAVPFDVSVLVVEVVPELPITPTGKISKAQLLAQALEAGLHGA